MIEWTAAALVILQVWGYGQSVRLGAAFGIASSLLWIVAGAEASMPSIIFLNAVLLCINVFNLYKGVRTNEGSQL